MRATQRYKCSASPEDQDLDAPLSTLIPVLVTGIQQRRVYGARDSLF